MVHSVESYKLDDIVERTTPSIDRRICISQKVRRYLAESYEKKFDSAETYIRRLNVIYNGIDEKEFTPNAMRKGKFKARFSIPENEKIISFIGRFSYEKQPILFVDIAQNLLSKSKHKLKFVMAGDGLDSEKVKNRIKEHGLEDYFILTGMIDYTAELLNDTDIFLVVSEYEGIPNAMLEAMSLGVPVISTDVGAISEVVENNVNGFLINPSNSSSNVIQSFTDTILELLRDQTKRSAVSGKAIETINQRFTLETMATNYERLFNELTKNYLDSSV
jgi:glycosyltransferase involved in cell wall biosynthesis